MSNCINRRTVFSGIACSTLGLIVADAQAAEEPGTTPRSSPIPDDTNWDSDQTVPYPTLIEVVVEAKKPDQRGAVLAKVSRKAGGNPLTVAAVSIAGRKTDTVYESFSFAVSQIETYRIVIEGNIPKDNVHVFRFGPL